ncbi:MAG: hypothetical protein ACRED8_01180 [Caulobacteraceae bacterium]
MGRILLIGAGLVAVALMAGCETGRTVNAKLVAPPSRAQAAALQRFVRPEPAYPSVGGNILAGTNPTVQARERDAADREAARQEKARIEAAEAARRISPDTPPSP